MSSSGAVRWIKVAYGTNEAEAQMIQGLLSEHGIPSMLKRAPGFDVPEFLPAGPRHVLVAEELVERARAALAGIGGDGG